MALKKKTQAKTNHQVTPTFGKKIRTRGSYTRSIFGYNFINKKSNIDTISKQSFDKKINALKCECQNNNTVSVYNQTLQKSYQDYYNLQQNINSLTN